jgi:hypothetical protein
MPTLSRWGRWRVAGLLVCWALAGACHDGTPTEPGTGSLTIRGSITSSKTAHGIANLIVALIDGGRVVAAAPTDTAGAFAFQHVAEGSYTVRVTGVELAGVDTRYTMFDPAETPVVAQGSGTLSNVFIAAVGLIPPRVTGLVSCAGSPAAGARIRVIGGATDIVVTTNAQGRYAATGLEAGHYAVIVESAPCAVTPAWRAADLLAAQLLVLDFAG